MSPNNEVKFRRDGARYVCKGCRKKYFTRQEVEACFDAHLTETKAPPTAGK